MFTAAHPDKGSPLGVSPLAFPLDEFYAQAGRSLPRIEAVPGDAMPQPYKTLLVHSNDMTPTLESFHGRGIHLHVLHRDQRDDYYFREVLLDLDDSDVPVEYGAIKINLALFPPAARRQILEEKLPLGHILEKNKTEHTSRPKAFFRIQADEYILKALRIAQPHWLYGRRNALLDPKERSLAEIVEILPPAPVNTSSQTQP